MQPEEHQPPQLAHQALQEQHCTVSLQQHIDDNDVVSLYSFADDEAWELVPEQSTGYSVSESPHNDFELVMDDVDDVDACVDVLSVPSDHDVEDDVTVCASGLEPANAPTTAIATPKSSTVWQGPSFKQVLLSNMKPFARGSSKEHKEDKENKHGGIKYIGNRKSDRQAEADATSTPIDPELLKDLNCKKRVNSAFSERLRGPRAKRLLKR